VHAEISETATATDPTGMHLTVFRFCGSRTDTVASSLVGPATFPTLILSNCYGQQPFLPSVG